MSIIRKFFRFVSTTTNYLYYNHKVRNIDYFDYEKLVYPNHKVPYGFASVLNYGNWKAVAKLKGSRFNLIKDYLEHGLSFFEDINAVPAIGYIDRKTIRTIYTYSDKRKETIEQYLKSRNFQKKVIAVGPYVLGADFFHSEKELKEIKDKHGKILLVIPVHSMEGASAQYSANDFIEKILEIRDKFNSIFICAYWKDLLSTDPFIELCKKNNFTIVSNGHRSDPMFLSRQKDLIFLSDMIMTNGIGSYIGYGISMNRPVYYYDQEYQYQLEDNPFENLVKNNEEHLTQIKHKFGVIFGQPTFEISEEQKQFIQEYWGSWTHN